MNDYIKDEFSPNYSYCNIHGDAIEVLEGDSGDIYIKMEDIKRTGFCLFNRSTFDSRINKKK